MSVFIVAFVILLLWFWLKGSAFAAFVMFCGLVWFCGMARFFATEGIFLTFAFIAVIAAAPAFLWACWREHAAKEKQLADQRRERLREEEQKAFAATLFPASTQSYMLSPEEVDMLRKAYEEKKLARGKLLLGA